MPSSNSSRDSAVPASGRGSGSNGIPNVVATCCRHRNPIARHSRACSGTSPGASAEYSAAESITASSDISHEAAGCGERNHSSTG